MTKCFEVWIAGSHPQGDAKWIAGSSPAMTKKIKCPVMTKEKKSPAMTSKKVLGDDKRKEFL